MTEFSTEITSQLASAIATMQPVLVAFCQKLIRTPSVNGVHPEIAVAEVIADEARQVGLTVELVAAVPDRPNVIVSAGTASGREIGLLLLGHLDTVPPGDEAAWTFPPFSGALHAGRVYGRGAVDTKGGMAAAIYARAALQQTGLLKQGQAQFIGVPDEETGATGTLGIRVLAARGLLAARGAIYAYSGDDITVGHRGLLRYEIAAHGAAAHTGLRAWQEREAGVNAVTALARLLIALEDFDRTLPYSHTPLFEPYRTTITPGTVVQGGASINIVPDRAVALVDIRLTPEYPRAVLEPQLHALSDAITAQTGARFTWTRLNDVPAVLSDADAPLFALLEAIVPQVTGRIAHRAVAGPANEGYLLIERGIPTVCGLGPAGEGAHGADEYVSVQGLSDAALVFALAAVGLDAELVK